MPGEKPIDCKALADELDELQKPRYNGNGVEVIRGVIFFLRRNNPKQAKAICFVEADKFYDIKDIRAVIIDKLFLGTGHPWRLSVPYREKKTP
ncbi:MAG: hypothetical protein KGI60_03255 [Patescibacteria group bacterium]|nr:hypothetical protein [Patescibacteria group bacterium]